MKRDENRNVECKESWHDKYFEWICGYANANADKDLPQGRLSDSLKTQRSILENGLGIGVSARHPYPDHHHRAPYKGMHEVVVHNSGGGAER